jgi:hypothetical protein
MQAFVHHTPHHTQVIKLHKNTMAATKLVAISFIVLLGMGLANTPHQIYASKFLNQASKSANSNTGRGGGGLTCVTESAPRPEDDKAGGNAGVAEERPGRSQGGGWHGRRHWAEEEAEAEEVRPGM